MVSLEEVGIINAIEDLPLREQEALAKRLVKKEFRKNTKIFSYGSPGSTLMFILSGNVAIVRTDPMGKMVTLSEQHSGDFFGELALIMGRPRSADVFTTSQSVMLELAHDQFMAHAKEFGGLTYILCRNLAERLTLTTHYVADLVFCDVTTRLLRVLEKASVPTEGNRRLVRERQTHDHLASLVGCSREVICRTLAALERAGTILQEDKTIWLL